MARDRRDNSKRNPSRNIKMHNRDEILRHVMEEQNGRNSDNKKRRNEIRQSVYSRSQSQGRNRRTQQPVKENNKKGFTIRGLRETPTLSNVLLPSKQSAEIGVVSNQKRRERQSFNVVAVIIAIILFVGCVAYAVVFAVKYLNRSVVANDTVSYGSIENAQICEGVIVRDEVLYTAPAGGEAVFCVSELDRVKANTDICYIQDTAKVENLKTDLNKINEEILEKQKTRESISAVSEEVKQYNNQIKSIVDTYAADLTNGNVSVIYSMKSDVQKNIDMRNQRLLTESSGTLSELSDKRNEQQSKIDQSISTVTSKQSGIVSCYSDGLESVYTVDGIADLQKNDTKVKNSGSVISKVVNTDEPIFKIVSSNDWYIVSYIPNSLIEHWQVGDDVTIYVRSQSDESIPLTVEVASLNTTEKESFVVLKSTKYVVDYINQRSISFETTKAITGYKIPNTAIVEQTMLKVAKEYVVDNKLYKKGENDTIIEISVVPAGENAEEGIVYIPFDINRINVGEVLTLPSDKTKTFTISDVVTTKGVFVMNTGVAEFCTINLENSSSNANYTVLDPGNNNNIKLYDRIATDTVNIQKQQKLIS